MQTLSVRRPDMSEMPYLFQKSEKLDRVGKKARGHKQTHRCQDAKDVKVDKGSQFDQGGECNPKNCAQDNTKKGQTLI